MAILGVLILGDDPKELERAKTSLSIVSEIVVAQGLADLGPSLMKMASDWVLFLRCEEVMSQPSVRKLIDFLKSAKADAFSFTIREFTDDSSIVGYVASSDVAGYSGFVPRDEVRLWRRSLGLSFSGSGAISVFPSLRSKGIEAVNVRDIRINAFPKSVPIGLLREVYEKDPSDVKSAYEYGVALLHVKDFVSAKEIFERLAVHNAMYRNTLVNLGIALLNLGDAKEAALKFLSALKDNPNDVLALNNLAAVFFMSGRLDRAEELYRKAISIDRKDPRLFKALIEVYRRLGKEDEAQRLLATARRLHPSSPILS